MIFTLTPATLLINQGVHAKIIFERLEHGNTNTIMIAYSHALRSADQSAADIKEQTASTCVVTYAAYKIGNLRFVLGLGLILHD